MDQRKCLMAEIEMAEFPFVAALPKREKSRLSKAMDLWNEVRAITKKEGPLLPQEFCARLAGVSKQRIHDLVTEGRLVRVKIGFASMITETSFEAWMLSTREPGRPKKIKGPFSNTRTAWKITKDSVNDMIEGNRERKRKG